MAEAARGRGFVAPAVERLLEVPPPPSAPWGDPRSAEVFRPSRGYLGYRCLTWLLHESWAIALMVVTIFFPEWIPDFGVLRWLKWDWMRTIELLALLTLPLVVAVTFLLVLLDYRNRWYVLTDRSLRIREGVWTVREMTISLANVQNIGLAQGPIQRLCGIADVEVATAGGGEAASGGEHSMHRGVLRGVADAESVRNRIVRSWKEARDEAAEPVSPVAAGGVDESPLVVAARGFAAEAAALRAAVAAQRPA